MEIYFHDKELILLQTFQVGRIFFRSIIIVRWWNNPRYVKHDRDWKGFIVYACTMMFMSTNQSLGKKHATLEYKPQLEKDFPWIFSK